MCSNYLKILLFLVVISLDPAGVLSGSDYPYPEVLNEKFVLFTDRNYYAVNERVLFKAFNNSYYLVKEKNWSKVFYIELLNREGIAAYKGKFILSETGVQGSFIIPSELPTDNYFLIGYTKWMRNFSPLDFAFVKLCIINPEKAYTNEQSTILDSAAVSPEMADMEQVGVSCSVAKALFEKREEVLVTLKFPKSWDTLSQNYCISVVKKAAVDPSDFGIIHSGIRIGEDPGYNDYIPEMHGITVSGRIVSVDDSIPYAKERVRLSVLGNRFDYLSTESDPEGKFVFSLQQTCNKNDMYISCGDKSLPPVKFLMDDDFFTENISFPTYPFALTEDEKQIAEEIMFTRQVNEAYYHPDILFPCYDTNTSDFYGTPSKTIYIKDYIELPNLQEVFFELMPEVMVLEKKGVKYLQVKGRIEFHPEFASNKPLVLIDRIPVSDIGELLTISPTRISRIELVNEVYIKGTSKFGGIISIFTKEGDLAGIRLPENSMFFNYTGFDPQPNAGELKLVSLEPHHPDFRNTLFWKPDFSARPGTEAQIKFNASDIAGEYVFLIRGVSLEGKIVWNSVNFEVR